MKHSRLLSFRSKLLLLFGLLSLLPLIMVAVIVSSTVQKSYNSVLINSFKQNMGINQRLINNFFDSNKSWIKSIAAQDFLITEMEYYFEDEDIDKDKLFSSLVSLRRENSYIEQIYITDLQGNIVVSSTTDNEGEQIANEEFLKTINSQRNPHFLRIQENENNTRILRLTTPFIRKRDGKVIGTLAADFNIAIIRSLFNSQVKALNNSYIIDSEGIALTALPLKSINPINSTLPFQYCNKSQTQEANQWIDYAGREVIGVYQCNQIDDLNLTLVTAEDANVAYSIINSLNWTIAIITVAISILLIIGILSVANSITTPIQQLQRGAQEFGKGNLGIKLNIKTGDELEDLGITFNDMALQVSKLITNLQVRDKELQNEKETISGERNKLKVIVSGISDGVIALDLNKNIILFNNAAEKITGLKEENVLNKSTLDLLSIEADDTELKEEEYIWKDNIVDSTAKSWQKIKLKLSEKSVPINLVSSRINDSSGMIIGTILTIHDLSNESQFEDMKLDFVSMAAHELRTPITSIRGYTSVLNEEIVNATTVEEKADWLTLLNRVSISSEQLLALVENLLNVTKIEKGILSISCHEENWSQCINEILDSLKENYKHKNITIEVKPTIDFKLQAYVDKMRIGEVTTNLITNAINYTPVGGHITISARLSNDGQFIETSVKDTGHGIPKSAQSHLFEKFFRVSGPLEQGSKGNGLGLYISKSIVNMHSGKIWVISDEGKGAEFIFTVPVAAVS